MVRHRLWRQHQVVLLGPGTHQMKRRDALVSVLRMAYCLAVNRHQLPLSQGESGLYPLPQADLEVGRIPLA